MMDTAFELADVANPRRPAAALMMEVLRSEGVRYIFGNPGTTEMPLVDALGAVQDISYVLGLQGASVVAMADGCATVAKARGSFGCRGFGSSWPSGHSFHATHPLWNGDLPTRAAEIRSCLEPFEAVLALGGIYPTSWSSVGDIRASLRAMLPDLRGKLESRRDEIALMREQATQMQTARKAGATISLSRPEGVLRSRPLSPAALRIR